MSIMPQSSISAYARFFGLTTPHQQTDPYEYWLWLDRSTDLQDRIFAKDNDIDSFQRRSAQEVIKYEERLRKNVLPLWRISSRPKFKSSTEDSFDYAKCYSALWTPKDVSTSPKLKEIVLGLRGSARHDAARIRRGVEPDKLLEDFAREHEINAHVVIGDHIHLRQSSIFKEQSLPLVYSPHITMPIGKHALQALFNALILPPCSNFTLNTCQALLLQKSWFAPCLLPDEETQVSHERSLTSSDRSCVSEATERPIKTIARPQIEVELDGQPRDEDPCAASPPSEDYTDVSTQDVDDLFEEFTNLSPLSTQRSDHTRLQLPSLAPLHHSLPSIDFNAQLKLMTSQATSCSTISSEGCQPPRPPFSQQQVQKLESRQINFPRMSRRRSFTSRVPSSSQLIYRPHRARVLEPLENSPALELDALRDSDQEDPKVTPDSQSAGLEARDDSNLFISSPTAVLSGSCRAEDMPTSQQLLLEDPILLTHTAPLASPDSLTEIRDHDITTSESVERARTDVNTSMADFFSLRGRHFKPHRQNFQRKLTELEEDPIVSSTQASNRTIEDHQGTASHVHPSVEANEPLALPNPACILVSTSMLKDNPSLVRFLEASGTRNLNLVYRDLSTPDQAGPDIILSPTTCLLMASLQALKQRPLPGQRSDTGLSRKHDTIMRLADDFERIVLLIRYRSAKEMQTQSMEELDILKKFACALADKAPIRIVPVMIYDLQQATSNTSVEKAVSKLIQECAYRYEDQLEESLNSEELEEEVDLVQQGVNAFAALLIARTSACCRFENTLGRPSTTIHIEKLNVKFRQKLGQKVLQKAYSISNANQHLFSDARNSRALLYEC